MTLLEFFKKLLKKEAHQVFPVLPNSRNQLTGDHSRNEGNSKGGSKTGQLEQSLLGLVASVIGFGLILGVDVADSVAELIEVAQEEDKNVSKDTDNSRKSVE